MSIRKFDNKSSGSNGGKRNLLNELLKQHEKIEKILKTSVYGVDTKKVKEEMISRLLYLKGDIKINDKALKTVLSDVVNENGDVNKFVNVFVKMYKKAVGADFTNLKDVVNLVDFFSSKDDSKFTTFILHLAKESYLTFGEENIDEIVSAAIFVGELSFKLEADHVKYIIPIAAFFSAVNGDIVRGREVLYKLLDKNMVKRRGRKNALNQGFLDDLNKAIELVNSGESPEFVLSLVDEKKFLYTDSYGDSDPLEQ